MIDERDIEGKLGRVVQERGGLCLKLDSSSKKGIQDRLVLLPGARVYFVELKRPTGGRVSVLQKVWKTRIERMGFRSCVIRNETELDELIRNWDNGDEETDCHASLRTGSQ
jgi:hypothetical protein